MFIRRDFYVFVIILHKMNAGTTEGKETGAWTCSTHGYIRNT